MKITENGVAATWQQSSPTGSLEVAEKWDEQVSWIGETIGHEKATRGGKQSHNRAIVAVARKLAVLLHRILDHTRAVHPVLCSSCLRIQTMFPVAKPRVPVTACRVGPSQGRPKTDSIDFSV
jgi:hypothetical protein